MYQILKVFAIVSSPFVLKVEIYSYILLFYVPGICTKCVERYMVRVRVSVHNFKCGLTFNVKLSRFCCCCIVVLRPQ